eukprot:COSAG05_NODE_2307_length_3247_cov_15.723316_2_plen_56_part_00
MTPPFVLVNVLSSAKLYATKVAWLPAQAQARPDYTLDKKYLGRLTCPPPRSQLVT